MILYMILGAVCGIVGYKMAEALHKAHQTALRAQERENLQKAYDAPRKCETCKHYVDRKDAQEVTVEERKYSYSGFGLGYDYTGDVLKFYCPMHKVNWDKEGLDGTLLKRVPAVPEHFVEIKPAKPSGKKKTQHHH